MTSLARIVLVQDMSRGGSLGLGALAEHNLLEQTLVVRDQEEALAFFHARAEQPSSGLPGLVLLGPDLEPAKSLAVLEHIRSSPQFHYVPVVMLLAARSEPILRRAYELGVNGIVVKTADEKTSTQRLNAVWSFWAMANVPPPGCLRCHELDDRERA